MQTAQNLQKENDLLRQKIAEQDAAIALKEKQLSQKAALIGVLEEKLKAFLHRRFGPSSEKASPLWPL